MLVSAVEQREGGIRWKNVKYGPSFNEIETEYFTVNPSAD